MWLFDVLRRLKFAGFAFISIMIINTFGYCIIGNDEMLYAFHMTTLTLTTTGFHEVIDMSTPPGGRIFTVFVAFTGIGIFTYALSYVAALFIEVDIRRTFYLGK